MKTILRKFKITIQNLFTTYFEINDQSMFDQSIILARYLMRTYDL